MITFVQPALPKYRMAFFEQLHGTYGAGMKVFYSPGSLGALTQTVSAEWAVPVGPIRDWLGVAQWQPSIARLPVTRGDIVVLSGNPRQISTLCLLLRAKRKGARTVWWGHYWSSTSKRWRQILRYLPLALADAALFYTDDEVEQARSDPMFPSNRVILTALNNGIDLKPILPLRKPYDVSEREDAVFFIGRLTRKAQLGLALEAIAQLGEPAPMLHVVGDGEMKQELSGRAQALGLGERVVWHGAMTEEAEIAKVANRCKLFLYPGEVGLSLIHAMAYGLPTIVHDDRLHHMPEIAAFEAGRTGASFRAGDPSSLARTIGDALAHPSTLQTWSLAGMHAADNVYNTAKMAERFVALRQRLEEDDR